MASGHTVLGTGVSTEQFSDCTRLLTPSLVGINWSAIKDIDAVIHLAANNDTLSGDEEEMMLANFHSAIMLFKHCLSMGCSRFVYASSASVYGDSPSPQTEDGPTNPLNVYARSKLRFEEFVANFAEQNKVESVVGLRYFNVYGPGEQHKGRRASMVSQIVDAYKHGKTVRLFKPGDQSRDWIYVDDVADINVAAMSVKGNHIVNVGTGSPRSFNDIVTALGLPVKVEYVDCPFASAFQNETCASTKKAEDLFGPRPYVPLEVGIKSLIRSAGCEAGPAS